MTPKMKIAVFSVVVLLGAWGCQRAPSAPTRSQSDRLKVLEARCARIEEDYRAAASTRDRLRRQLALLDEQRQQEETTAHAQQEKIMELEKLLAQERAASKKKIDELLAKERAATNKAIQEREALQARCDRLKVGLQELLGQDQEWTNTRGSDKPVPVMSIVVD
jgi:hypothetical protein